MITKNSLEVNFGELSTLEDGLLTFADVVPAFSFVYYLNLGHGERPDLLAVSQDAEDPTFATTLLRCARDHLEPAGESPALRKVPISGYELGGFTHLLFAPPSYHRYFSGRLDNERAALYLCLPIHRSEFSGAESPDLFLGLARRFIATRNWRRSIVPRIMARYYNPSTGTGTGNREPIAISIQVLEQELANLNGVSKGFIELTSYRDDYAEVVSPAPDIYTFRHQSEPSPRPMDLASLEKEMFAFLGD